MVRTISCGTVVKEVPPEVPPGGGEPRIISCGTITREKTAAPPGQQPEGVFSQIPAWGKVLAGGGSGAIVGYLLL